MSDCPRCKKHENYGCSCTLQELLDHSRDRIAELEEALDSEHAVVGSNIWRFWSDRANASSSRNQDLFQRVQKAKGTLQGARAAFERLGFEDESVAIEDIDATLAALNEPVT